MQKSPQVMLNGAADLMRWFEENQATTYQAGMGVKALELPGSLTRDMPVGEMSTFWRKVVENLPADAAFVKWGDSQFVLQRPSVDRYYDQYFILLGSREWPPIENGGLIPNMQLVQNSETGEVTLTEPT